MLKLKIENNEFAVDKMIFDGPRTHFGIVYDPKTNQKLSTFILNQLQLQTSLDCDFITFDLTCDNVLYTGCFIEKWTDLPNKIVVFFNCTGQISGGYENANI